MKKHLIASLIVFILGLFSIWGIAKYINSKNSQTFTPTFELIKELEEKGLHSFQFTDLDGVKTDVSSFAGQIVIINFWASWCAPCIEEVPSLIKLVEHFKGRVKLVAVSGDSELKDIEVFMKSFPELKRQNIYIVFDQDKSIMQRFGVNRLPESLIFGTNLKLEKKIVGTIDWYNPDSIAYTEELLAKP